MVHRAIARGEIAPTADPRLILDAFIAPLHFKALFTNDPLEDRLAAEVADLVLDGVLPRR